MKESLSLTGYSACFLSFSVNLLHYACCAMRGRVGPLTIAVPRRGEKREHQDKFKINKLAEASSSLRLATERPSAPINFDEIVQARSSKGAQ
jgi:hypothetical protein